MVCIRTFFKLSADPLKGLENAAAAGSMELMSAAEDWSDVAVSRDPDASAVGCPLARVNSAKAVISTAQESRQPYMTTVRWWYDGVQYGHVRVYTPTTEAEQPLDLYDFWPQHRPCVCVCTINRVACVHANIIIIIVCRHVGI